MQLHCFFLTLITVFSYVWSHISISVLTIFSFCVFIFTFFFMLFSPRDIFYNLQCLIQFHYNLCVTFQRSKKVLHSPLQKKKCSINNNPMFWYFRGTKYEFFLPPYQLSFFLVFDQAANQKMFLAHALASHFNEHS